MLDLPERVIVTGGCSVVGKFAALSAISWRVGRPRLLGNRGCGRGGKSISSKVPPTCGVSVSVCSSFSVCVKSCVELSLTVSLLALLLFSFSVTNDSTYAGLSLSMETRSILWCMSNSKNFSPGVSTLKGPWYGLFRFQLAEEVVVGESVG